MLIFAFLLLLTVVPRAVVLGYTFAGCFASNRQEWAGLHLDPETVADPASAVKAEGKYSSNFLLIPFYQPGLQPGTICLYGGEEECCHRSCEGLGVDALQEHRAPSSP